MKSVYLVCITNNWGDEGRYRTESAWSTKERAEERVSAIKLRQCKPELGWDFKIEEWIVND